MLQYRAALVIWLIGHVLEPLVYLAVWTTVARSSAAGSVGGYSAADFAAYFMVLMLVNHVTYTWIMWEYEYRVRHGRSPSRCCARCTPSTPTSPTTTSKIVTLPLILAAAAVLVLVFRPMFHCQRRGRAAAFAGVAAARLRPAIPDGVDARPGGVLDDPGERGQPGLLHRPLFLSGQMAPLSLLPRPFQLAASVLPFRWITSFPVELLLGRLAPSEALWGIGVQAAWLVLLPAPPAPRLARGRARYSAVGA